MKFYVEVAFKFFIHPSRVSLFLVLINLCLHFRNIVDLTSQVNNLEIKVNDSELENEELRERLGMDPKEQLDIEDVRHKKKVKAEQAVALNRALAKEVCITGLV